VLTRHGQAEHGSQKYYGGPAAGLTRAMVTPLMSKRTVKRKLRTKKKANHGKKPNCGRG
jgi:hypothetical protein